jgi:hypothetical protein
VWYFLAGVVVGAVLVVGLAGIMLLVAVDQRS